ncbi:ATP-binding protein [Stenotrophomonas sp. CFBP8980]|uniref:ATP-binding protein n=1 Tax=Stenotrophomonas sp. CFBP8980 TaxID=3096523 RepID=UPI002A69CDDC|nr:ATP-binding protein [Stenotrophomonas sp. CFBP8980]MDY1035187.1 ATP-binding protein [Stenotrophomonas sp. CFBP8980]
MIAALQRWSIALRRGWPSAVAMLMFTFPAVASAPEFTAAERQWIAEHPVVYYAGAPNVSPLEDIVDGKYQGLIAAYLDTISERTGLSFQIVPTRTWEESQQVFLQGRVDLFPNASPTTVSREVDRSLRYSQAYFASPLILVTRGDAASTFGPDTLKGKRVAIRGGPDIQKILTDRRPGAIPIEVISPEESLRKVVEGEAYASVGTEATLSPLLRRKYGRQLGTASMLDIPPYRAQMGVRASNPMLLTILGKALGSITAHESDEIYERYLSQADYGAPTIWSILHYRRVELMLLLLSVALLAFFGWRAREERRRAVRSEQTKARFLATMSHEIRTPINAMLGSIELLGRTPLDKRQRGFTDGATVAAEALMDLLDNVLDLSKLDAGKLTLEKLPTDVRELLQQAVDLIRPRADEKGLMINYGLEYQVNGLVMIDPTRLRQIVNNLLGNAVKFTKRGCINLDARLEPSSPSDPRSATLLIRITDTGVGIPFDQQHHLFQAYSQADGSTTREFGGTGLGLTICRELVTMMGGSITLDSIPETGTTVVLAIPVSMVETASRVVDPAGPDRACTAPEAHDAPPGTVLVVEDHPGNRSLIQQQLLELGVAPTLVESGEAALAILAQQSFDLVLMDCHMPGMDGYETTRRIRAVHRAEHLPVVAISASTGAEHLARCLECGMDGVLRKPLRLQELQGILELWPVRIVPRRIEPVEPAGIEIDHEALLSEDLNALDAALARGELDRALHYAHRINGAALMLDRTELARCAQAVESALSEGGKPSDGLMNALHTALNAATG